LAILLGGFLFVFAWNLEEMDGSRPDSLFYSAKRVRISLGGKDRFSVFLRNSPAYHISLSVAPDHFPNHAASGPIWILGFGRFGFSQGRFWEDGELGFGNVPFTRSLESQPFGCESCKQPNAKGGILDAQYSRFLSVIVTDSAQGPERRNLSRRQACHASNVHASVGPRWGHNPQT